MSCLSQFYVLFFPWRLLFITVETPSVPDSGSEDTSDHQGFPGEEAGLAGVLLSACHGARGGKRGTIAYQETRNDFIEPFGNCFAFDLSKVTMAEIVEVGIRVSRVTYLEFLGVKCLSLFMRRISGFSGRKRWDAPHRTAKAHWRRKQQLPRKYFKRHLKRKYFKRHFKRKYSVDASF